MKKVVTVIAVVVMSSALASAAIVDYQFNDDAGTNWKDVAQTGTDPGQWNGRVLNALTDGAGAAHFTGLTANETRKHTLAADITSGIIAMEYSLSDWNMVDSMDTSGFQFSLAEGTTIGVKLKIESHTTLDDAGLPIKENLKLISEGSETVNKIFYNVAGGKPWDMLVRAEVDLDNNTYDTMWKHSYDSEWFALTTGGSFTIDIGELRMVTAVPAAWAAGEFIDVDYVTLETIPEPATLALLGLGALVSMRRKRA